MATTGAAFECFPVKHSSEKFDGRENVHCLQIHQSSAPEFWTRKAAETLTFA